MQTLIKIFAAIGGLTSLALLLALALAARGELALPAGSPVLGAASGQAGEETEATDDAEVITPAERAMPIGRAFEMAPALGRPAEQAITIQGAGPSWVPEGDRVEGPGIVLSELFQDGPAHRAGLTRGDILLRVDGQSVDRPGALQAALEDRSAGETVRLEYQRGDAVREAEAQIELRGGRAWLGIAHCSAGMMPSVMAMPAMPLDAVEWVEAAGEVIEVVEGSAAEAAGLRPGDRILALDGQELGLGLDLGAAIAEREPGDRLRLSVERPAAGADAEPRTLEIELELGAHPEDPARAFLGVSYATAISIEIGGLEDLDVQDGFGGSSREFHLEQHEGPRRFFDFFLDRGDSAVEDEPAAELEGPAG